MFLVDWNKNKINLKKRIPILISDCDHDKLSLICMIANEIYFILIYQKPFNNKIAEY